MSRENGMDMQLIYGVSCREVAKIENKRWQAAPSSKWRGSSFGFARNDVVEEVELGAQSQRARNQCAGFEIPSAIKEVEDLVPYLLNGEAGRKNH
jgi:hypothetical protein